MCIQPRMMSTDILYTMFNIFNVMAMVSGTLMFGQEVCYDQLGCFRIDGDFSNVLSRPFNWLPQSPETINTKFLLYTRRNRARPQEVSRYSPDTITSSALDTTKPLKFIVHGFGSDGSAMQSFKNALLNAEDVNVVIVDWANGAKHPYPQAVSNTRIVGAEIGKLVQYLHENQNFQYKDAHVIGHSLGAHVAGYSGATVNGSLGRISGLDPAEPYFNWMPRSVRLDETDALFVDVLHTDGGIVWRKELGIFEPIGDVDFYPDGGRGVASCSLADTLYTLADTGLLEAILGSCSHSRAPELYLRSLTSPSCQFISHACKDYDDYLAAKCTECGSQGENCQKMGYYATPNPASYGKSFYLTTNSKPPEFCLFHWAVRVTVSKSQSKARGKLVITLYGNTSESASVDVTPSNDYRFESGKSYAFIVGLSTNIGFANSIDLKWEEKKLNFVSDAIGNFLGRKAKSLQLDLVVLEPMDIINNSDRQQGTVTFCSSVLQNGIENHKTVAVTKESCLHNEQ